MAATVSSMARRCRTLGSAAWPTIPGEGEGGNVKCMQVVRDWKEEKRKRRCGGGNGVSRKK